MTQNRKKRPSRAVFLAVLLLGIAALAAATLYRPRGLRAAPAAPALPRTLDARQLEAARANNLGVAYMNREAIQEAAGFFQRAYALDPKLTVARLNEAIAEIYTQQYPPARTILEGLSRTEPANPYVWYCLGLLEMDTNHPHAALAALEHVTQIDARDPDTHYFIGKMHLQLRQYPQAIAAFQATLRLDPFHVSAEFAMAQAYQRSGNLPAARQHLAVFQHLNQAKLGAPLTLVYGQQGRYAEVVDASTGLEAVPAPIPVHFEDVTAMSGLPTTASPPRAGRGTVAGYFGSGACVFDYDGDGKPDILLLDVDGAPALYHNLGDGHFANVTKDSGIALPGPGIGCTVGDFNNDGRADVAISYNGGIALFENLGNGKFADVTRQAGIDSHGLFLGLTFVDYHHDGFADLYAARFPDLPVNRATGQPAVAARVPAGADVMWQNNGNGKFTDSTAATGLEGSGLDVAPTLSDVNRDRAVDLVLTSWHGPVIYLNPREGKFRPVRPWATPFTAPTIGVTALDFNKDGWMDLAFTQAGSPAVTLWRNLGGKKFVRVGLPHLDWARAWGLTALDYDNDGWLDLAAVGTDARGRGHIVLFRNDGPSGFRDVTAAVGLNEIALRHPRSLIAADFFGDGGTDLLITQNGGPPVLLRNVGANRNHWLSVKLVGINDTRDGIGTKMRVFAGTLHQKFELAAASGYLGQGPLTITAGLGSQSQADIVRMLWPTGVLQDEIHIAGDASHTINEIDRKGSSCPLLFAWDGRRFSFISDILGPGIVGHWIAPGRRNIPNPEEYLKVPGSLVRARGGRLRFRLIEPMEELDYLDRVRLLAVDHPAGTAVYSNSRFEMNPPFPPLHVFVTQGEHPPVGAWDGQGRNILPLLLKEDHRFVDGMVNTPYAGIVKTHALELDLGAWNPRNRLRLVLAGFTDYFSATSLFAAAQVGLRPIPPYVEALERDGRWHRVLGDMGFPAGLERTMVADLTGLLPPGTRRIRIVTNLKVYWDRILVDNAPANLPFRLTSLPLTSARLDFRGYPRAIEGHLDADLSYDYNDVSLTGPYARQVGNYTRYGNVLPLLESGKEEYVIFGSGDEVALDFNPASLAPLPPGWVRDYLFYANGYDKDMDFFAYDGLTVDPLPFHTLIPYPYPSGVAYPEDPRHVRYQLDYNTRPVAGPTGDTYRFQYRRLPAH